MRITGVKIGEPFPDKLFVNNGLSASRILPILEVQLSPCTEGEYADESRAGRRLTGPATVWNQRRLAQPGALAQTEKRRSCKPKSGVRFPEAPFNLQTQAQDSRASLKRVVVAPDGCHLRGAGADPGNS